MQIIDEKSLIKKYQREISALKLELEQLRRGMLVGVNPEEIMSLKQKVPFFYLICHYKRVELLLRFNISFITSSSLTQFVMLVLILNS